jgi:acetyltransferase-like isoleucine patch superfamily enzyme
MKISDKIFFVIQSCIKYNSFGWGIWLRSFLYKFFFKKFGKNIQIKDGVTFKYPSEIEMGSNIKIGEFSYFVGNGGLYLGDNVLIGAGTKIITSTHNFDDIETSMFDQGLSFSPIRIKNDVWFGFDCKVFGNTIINEGVIIGANSLIKNTETPSYVILAGNPAKFLRKRGGAETKELSDNL